MWLLVTQCVSIIAGKEYHFDTSTLRWLSTPAGAGRTVSSLRGMTSEQLRMISEGAEAQMWCRHATSSSDEGAGEMRQRASNLVAVGSASRIPCG